MNSLNEIVTRIDDFVWGPVMLILLVGTGIFLTCLLYTSYPDDVSAQQKLPAISCLPAI